jgi:phosphoglycolate phosphatase-like HAD superfamily hydrolase
MGATPRLRLDHAPVAHDFDVILMDCDGVIFDVNQAKVHAFSDALDGYPTELVDRFIDHHKAHGGVSRYAKFRWFFTEVLAVADADARIQDALARYGAASRAAYSPERLRSEALNFIARMAPVPVYVVSGSDQDELRAVFDAHRLTDRVAGVWGSPTPKLAHAEAILASTHTAPARALFVGDGRAELDVAVALGLPFVFLGEMTDWTEARDSVLAYDRATMVDTWTELLGRITEGEHSP